MCFVYVSVCVCVLCVCVCVCACLCEWVCVCVSINAHAVYASCMCIPAYYWVCVCVCVCVCACLCEWVCVCVHKCTCCICKLYVHNCILLCVCVCVCVCINAHAVYMQAMCAYLHIVCVRVCVCVCVCINAHAVYASYVCVPAYCVCVCVGVYSIPVCRVCGYFCVHIVSGEFCSILNWSLYQNTNHFEQTDSCVNTQIIAFMIAGPHRVLLWCMYCVSTQWRCNNNGHFYGAWSLARSRAQCAVQKAAEKCIKTLYCEKCLLLACTHCESCSINQDEVSMCVSLHISCASDWNILTYMHTHTHTHTRTHALMHACTHTCTYTGHPHTCIHTSTHSYANVRAHTTHATHTHTHVDMHTHTHTHTHTRVHPPTRSHVWRVHAQTYMCTHARCHTCTQLTDKQDNEGKMSVFIAQEGYGGKLDEYPSLPELVFSGDQFACTFRSRIALQWLHDLRWLWMSVLSWAGVSSISWWLCTLCLETIISQLRLHWVTGVCLFSCNLIPALLAEWPGSFNEPYVPSR